jgi:hypothetical protein
MLLTIITQDQQQAKETCSTISLGKVLFLKSQWNRKIIKIYIDLNITAKKIVFPLPDK